ncbi:hypothetical protein BHM03_00005815 [Ensete ventricosum]|nr:hypothetical protein BHM03_00005815 [Ensete ventricosum]
MVRTPVLPEPSCLGQWQRKPLFKEKKRESKRHLLSLNPSLLSVSDQWNPFPALLSHLALISRTPGTGFTPPSPLRGTDSCRPFSGDLGSGFLGVLIRVWASA